MTRAQVQTLARLRALAKHTHAGTVGTCTSWECQDFLEVIGRELDDALQWRCFKASETMSGINSVVRGIPREIVEKTDGTQYKQPVHLTAPHGYIAAVTPKKTKAKK